LIISVYDQVKALELILYALSIQSFKDFEVIVAEDGSNPEIKKLVDDWQRKKVFTIKHLTQDDRGFRKNKILNEAIKNSSADYLIFIDGDCIPHPDFLKAHFENKENDMVLCGRRVNLTKNISEKITPNQNKFWIKPIPK
jgi:glycosyltransferase involved in cell wall biosynthesis